MSAIALAISVWWSTTGAKWFEAIGKTLVAFINTPIGAAIVAATVSGIFFNIHGHHKEKIKWEQKWQVAEQKAELERLARDKSAKAAMKADADKRIATIEERRKELEDKVKQYEAEQALAGTGVAACDLADSSDDERLHALEQRLRKSKPKTIRGLTDRLRAPSGRNPGPFTKAR